MADSIFAMEIDLTGKVLKTSAPKDFMRAFEYSIELNAFRNSGNYDFSISTSDTLYHFDKQTLSMYPIPTSTGRDEEGGWMIIYQKFPDRYFMQYYKAYEYKNITLLSTLKDSYKTSKVELINDLFGNIPAKFSFYKGYYAASYEPIELMEVIEERLNDPYCSSEDNVLLKRFLKTINGNDCNILFVGKLKK